MDRLKEDEFKIWEQDKLQPRKKTMHEVMQETLVKECEYYNNKITARRENIRNGRDPMSEILFHPNVKNLFELGEINYKTAIKLDFFATLNKLERSVYCEVLSRVLEEEIQVYLSANRELGLVFLEFKTTGIFANSALNNAKTMAMKKANVEKLTKGKINAMRTKNYEKNWKEYQESMDHMEKLLISNDCCESTNMCDLEYMRIATSKNIVAYAKMLDRYNIFNGGEGALNYYSAINLLRYCSLPKETLKEVKNSKRAYITTMSKGFLEMSEHRDKSKLIVVDSSQPIAPQQEK